MAAGRASPGAPMRGNATADGREYTGTVVPILGTRGGRLGTATRVATGIRDGRGIAIRVGDKPGYGVLPGQGKRADLGEYTGRGAPPGQVGLNRER